MAEASSFNDPVVDAEVIDSSVIDEGNLRRLLRKAGRGVARPALEVLELLMDCLLYTSPSPRDRQKSRMPSSA